MRTLRHLLRNVLKGALRLLLESLQPVSSRWVYTMRRGPARGLKRRGGFAFIPSAACQEERFLSGLDLTGRVIYDVGANIGILTMFLARAVGPTGRVVGFEPNPEALRKLRENLSLNGFSNVDVHPVAVGYTRDVVRLVVPRSRAGLGSINPDFVTEFESSRGRSDIYEVTVVPLDEYFAEEGLPIPNFVKIDVEGLEYECLQGMRSILATYKPCLFIEMHGSSADTRGRNAERVLDLLERHRYDVFSVEGNQRVSADRNPVVATRGHLYCKSRENAT